MLFSFLESGGYRKYYYNYLNKFSDKPPRLISTNDNNGNQSTPPLPDHLEKFLNPQKQLNITSMGVLGDIFDLETDPKTGKINLQTFPWRFQEVKNATEDLLRHAPSEVPPHIKEIIAKSVNVRTLTENSVLVTAPFVSYKWLSGISQAILHRFQQIGMNCATFAYRKSGLESNDSLIGFTMADETIEIIKNHRGFSFHLLFDKSVWEMQERLLAARIEQFENAQTDSERESVIRMTNYTKEPFLPFSGIATTEWVTRDNRPVELKRYFSNELEDPLNLTQLSPKNSFKLRQSMLFKLIEELPPQTMLEVHAHTILHKKAYLRLGLKEFKVEKNPLYPQTKISVLRGQREDVLSALANLLDKIE